MPDGPGTPGPPQNPPPPPSRPPPPGGKRPAVGLQLKLPCLTVDEVRIRYGDELRQNRFFIRTKQPRAKETLVRLEALLATPEATPCFRAAAVVLRAQEPPAAGQSLPAGSSEPGMLLQLLAVDEAGRDLILSLGGKPPPALKADPGPRPGQTVRTSSTALSPVGGPGPTPAPPRAGSSGPRTAPGEGSPVLPTDVAGPGGTKTSASPSVPKAGTLPPAPRSGTVPPVPKAATLPPAPKAGTVPPPARQSPSMPAITPAGGTPPLASPAAPAPPGPSGPQSEAARPQPPSIPAQPAPAGATPAAAGRPIEPALPPPVMAPGPAGPIAPTVVPDIAPPLPPPELARKGPIIGIDLGTTNSCAAVVQKGKPFVIPSREGYNTIPSIVALNEKGKLIIGHPAKGQMLTNPRNTVYGAKRLVGRAFASPVVTDLLGRFQYQIVAGVKGEAAVQLGDQQFSLQKISALVLGEVKEIAQAYLQTEVSRAVITVPAYYNDNQRQAVREAGALAGLSVERILNEPTAAALAFAHGRQLEQRVLVYDLGGGTFDASVLELHGNVYEVVSTGGDTFLGGVDFDKVLVDHLLSTFKETNGIDFPGDRVALQRVTDAAERAKIGLSEQFEYKVRVPFVAMVGDKPYDLDAVLSRSELVLLTGHLVDRTLKVCEEVLAARNLKASDIDEVLLVGGQSRMPLVRERIRIFFGREPSKAVHPDEAVALGAALLAEQMNSPDIEGVVLVDVLPMSIGIGLPGGRFKKVIERNTSLPHKRGYSISTTKDDQPSFDLAIFQGESEKAQGNEYLGTLRVADLPKGPRGTVSFDIQFALSAECLLTVTALEKGTGRTISAKFTTQDTPEAVKKKLDEEGEEGAATAPVANGSAAPAGGGFMSWLKRIFGGSPSPRA